MDDRRHFGKYNGEDVIVVGYNKGDGSVMLVRPTALNSNDRNELLEIINSVSAQNVDYLVNILKGMSHRETQTDWFTYLARTMQDPQRKGVVVVRPFKDITNMNKQQRAVFAGYGVPIEKQRDELPLTKDSSVPMVALDDDDLNIPSVGSNSTKVENTQVSQLTDMMFELTEQMRNMNKTLSSLANQKSNPTLEKKVPAKRGRKKKEDVGVANAN